MIWRLLRFGLLVAGLAGSASAEKVIIVSGAPANDMRAKLRASAHSR